MCVVTDNTWERATLPIESGVGVRAAKDMALPAFLASVCSVRDLADGICGSAHDADCDGAHESG